MFHKTSKAGTGWAMVYTFILMELARIVDFPLTEGEAYQLVQSIMVFGGLILAVFGQFMRDDLEWGLFRKSAK